jgi:hypothetical protein
MRALRTAMAALAVLLALVLAAAWFGPAMLDWGRYRVAIAALAGAALGRPVRIDGTVALRLLPEPVLTASDIAVVQPDGAGTLSARALRLQVALGPLFAGRVDARDLVLDHPVLRLAWPPPAHPPPGPVAAGAASPPAVPRYLPPLTDRPRWLASAAARVEDGTLIVGDVTISGISATLVTDPDTHALVTAGDARLFGLPWRFTARLGTAGADGATTLQATLDGEGRVRDTGGRFSGLIAADGSLAGQISGRGGDLSQLLPAPAVPWRAEGRLTASGGLAAADELTLEIAGSPARGAVALRVAPMPRLDVALAAGRLDLDAWLPVLLRGTSGQLPIGIDLSAEAASLAGGTLRALRGAFDLGADRVVVRDASAILPGEASLQFSGEVPVSTAGPPAPFQGRAAITLPDLRTTLRWLATARVVMPAELPPEVLHSGELEAAVTLSRQSATLADLSGTIDGSVVAGQVVLGFGAQPSLALSMQLDRLGLDRWLAGAPGEWDAAVRLAQGPQTELHVRVGAAAWHGITGEAVALDAVAGGGRLAVQHLDATVQGLHVALSAAISDAGRVSDARLDVTAAHADALAGLVRQLAGETAADAIPAALLRGPIRVQAQASGPREALAGSIGIELADGQAVVQPAANLATGVWSAMVTLRHPGAPRLLDLLGLPGAAGWLGEGSLSLIGEFSGAPGRIAADRFDVTAAGLRAGGALVLEDRADSRGADGHSAGGRGSAGRGSAGQGSAGQGSDGQGSDSQGSDGQGSGAPKLSGTISAEALPLPLPDLASGDPLPFGRLRGWSADVGLEAAQVLADGLPLLGHAALRYVLQDGRLRLEQVTARLAGPDGGSIAGDAEVNAAGAAPEVSARGRIEGASAGSGLLGSTVDLRGGSLDADFDLRARGSSPAALRATLAGSVRLAMRGGQFVGFDAAGAATSGIEAALAAAPGVAAARAALAGGATSFSDLEFPITLADGVATLAGGQITLPLARASVGGTIDFPGSQLDLRAAIQPAAQGAPSLRVELIGPLKNPAHLTDLSDLQAWLTQHQ